MVGKVEFIYFLIIIILIVSFIPNLLLIGAIRKAEYRKELLNEINHFDGLHNEVTSGKCKIDGSNDIVKTLKEVRPYMANHTSPSNFVELQLENKNNNRN